MTETERLSIGEFSRLTWLSPKALRLYERRGLLPPAVVDEYTGYRYYHRSQAEVARTIALLRRVGMPLGQISVLLGAGVEQRRGLIEDYRAEIGREHERAVALLDAVASGAAGGRSPRDVPAVRHRTVEAWAFVSRSVRTTAADLPSHIERMAAALVQRAGTDVVPGAPLSVVYHGEVSWESDGPVEVRVPVADRRVADGSEAEGRELFVEVPFGEVQFPTILRFFDAVREAAERDGLRAQGPPREIYFEGDPFTCQVAQRYDDPSVPSGSA